jgi:hypothetical protein
MLTVKRLREKLAGLDDAALVSVALMNEGQGLRLLEAVAEGREVEWHLAPHPCVTTYNCPDGGLLIVADAGK